MGCAYPLCPSAHSTARSPPASRQVAICFSVASSCWPNTFAFITPGFVFLLLSKLGLVPRKDNCRRVSRQRRVSTRRRERTHCRKVSPPSVILNPESFWGEGPHDRRSTFQAYLCDPPPICEVPRLRSG